MTSKSVRESRGEVLYSRVNISSFRALTPSPTTAVGTWNTEQAAGSARKDQADFSVMWHKG